MAPPEEVGTSPQEYGSTCAIVRTGPRVLVSFTWWDVRPWGLRTDPGRETGARADTFDDGKKDDGAARRGFLFPAVRRRPDATAVATRAAVIPAEGGRGIHHRSVRGSSREGPRRRGRGCGRGEDSDSTSREVLFDRARFEPAGIGYVTRAVRGGVSYLLRATSQPFESQGRSALGNDRVHSLGVLVAT